MNAPGLGVGYSGYYDPNRPYHDVQYGQPFSSPGPSVMSIFPVSMVPNYPRLGEMPPSAAGAICSAPAPMPSNMLLGPDGFSIAPGGPVPNLMSAMTGQPDPSASACLLRDLFPPVHE